MCVCVYVRAHCACVLSGRRFAYLCGVCVCECECMHVSQIVIIVAFIDADELSVRDDFDSQRKRAVYGRVRL